MKILYVTTISNTVNAFLIPHIKMLIEQGHQVDVGFNLVEEVEPEIHQLGCKIHQLNFERSPLSKQNYIAYKQLKKIILREQYDIIHTHTPVASAIVRLVCKQQKQSKVFYTAHGFHFFKGAPLKNWLIYYPLEKWLSNYTDLLITINKEDYTRTRRNFKAKSIEYIPGVGLDLRKFRNKNVDKLDKRRELKINNDAIAILSVGEINKNKNHETIIKALAKLQNSKIVYLICGKGPLEKDLQKLAIKLKVDSQIKFLGYRKDIPEICNACDIFAFPSRREGLGMAAIEAMATGLPLITSNVHGIVDYSKNGISGFSCNPTDVNSFANNIKRLIEDQKMLENMKNNNIRYVKKYSVEEITTKLKILYKRFDFNREHNNEENKH